MRAMGDLSYNQLNTLQRLVVRHVHPVVFVFHLLSLIWVGYFLWIHRWVAAILVFVLLFPFGALVSWLDRDYISTVKLALNPFQRLVVYHADFRNLLFHIIGFGFYVFGMWRHSVILLLIAVSFLLLGNIVPWLRHSRKEGLDARAIDEDVSHDRLL